MNQQPYDDGGTYLYTSDERFRTRQPNNKRKISNSIIACCTCCCCCLPVGFLILCLVYAVGLFLIAPQLTANLQATVPASTSSGVSLASQGEIRQGFIAENGLKYVIMKNSFIKNRFSTLMQVYTGSVNEEDGEEGISHMVEHMAFDNSKGFPGRGGVWNEIENSNVGVFNAYTYFRSTVYQLLDNKIGDSPEESFKRIMEIFLNQVQLCEVKNEYLDIERGAVLGEARRANNSYYHALISTFTNHGGDTFRISKRFPIGILDSIRSWKAADLQQYFDKWYKLSNMKLFIVGDFDLDKLESMVKSYWASKVSTNSPKPTQFDPGYASPKSPLVYLDEIDGLNGINFNLITTGPYESYPRDQNYYRKELGDLLFQISYTLQVLAKMTLQYPNMDFGERSAGASITNEYPFASKLGILSIFTPGPQPELSTWREDFKIAIDELKQLADEPYTVLTIALSYALDIMYSAPTYYANTQDSLALVYELLGNEDPNYEYMNVHDSYSIKSRFLGVSFAFGSMNDHIKATAQYLLQGLSDIVDPNQPTIFGNLKRSKRYSSLPTCILH